MHFEDNNENHSVNKQQPIMKALKSPFTIEPSKELSEIDIIEIRSAYKCERKMNCKDFN